MSEVGCLVVTPSRRRRNWGDPPELGFPAGGVSGCWEGGRRNVQRRGRGFAELPQRRRGWQLRSGCPGTEDPKASRGGRAGAAELGDRGAACAGGRGRAAGVRRESPLLPAPGAQLWGLRAGVTPTAVRLPEGARAAVWEGKLDRVGLETGDAAKMRRLGAGESRGTGMPRRDLA